MKKSLKIVGVVFLIVILIMIASYLGICVYFNERFFPGSTINGIDASGRKVEEVEELVAADVRDYTIVLKLKDGKKESIDGGLIEFEYVSDGAVEELKNQQNSFFWLEAYFHPISYTMHTKTTYNQDMLKDAMKSLECFKESNIIKPVNAKMIETDKGYVIEPEVEGNELNQEKTFELLKAAVDEAKTELDLAGSDCYRKPKVTSENKNLKKKTKLYNKYFHLMIVYSIGDAQEVLDYEAIRDWMSMDEQGNVDFNWNKAADWMAQLSDKYDTLGTNMKFVTTNGETVKVKHENYGWKIDEAGEVEELLQLLEKCESTERDPLYLETGRVYGEDGNDIGDTYVEIDYTNQHMWFYKDGELLVDTPIVTGNTSRNMGSPVGIFVLYNKEEKAILRGADDRTGKGTYNTPVDYWMPFSGGVGIHDSKWRSSYGGEIYKSSGSHGCINTPWEAAKTIYENISVGVPIVCYESGTNYGGGTQSISQPPETRVIDKNGNEVKNGTQTEENQEDNQAGEDQETSPAEEPDIPVVTID